MKTKKLNKKTEWLEKFLYDWTLELAKIIKNKNLNCNNDFEKILLKNIEKKVILNVSLDFKNCSKIELNKDKFLLFLYFNTNNFYTIYKPEILIMIKKQLKYLN